MLIELRRHLRHNFTVGVMDGAFFGMGLGFASSVTIIPLFLDTLTDSTTLIGLAASMQLIGFQLPQILTSNRVAKLRRYLPMVLWMTLHERWPFFALAIIALGMGTLGNTLALILTFVMLSWHALGGGFTATAWQSLIGKVIPARLRGTFWGTQAAAASIMTAIGAYVAGLMLEGLPYPQNFALCFFLAGVAMMISMGFLSWTREPATDHDPAQTTDKRLSWRRLQRILASDRNLRMFMLARIISQFGWMAVAFYTIYGVRQFGMSEATAGIMLAVLTILQTVANPLLGWLGDAIGHRRAFALGSLAMGLSAFLALAATSEAWLYPAFALAGVAQASIWTIAMAMTLEFGTEVERPYYIGLSNTLSAPATLVAPIIGGWLVDAYSFDVAFGLAALAGVLTAAVLLFVVHDPARESEEITVPAVQQQ